MNKVFSIVVLLALASAVFSQDPQPPVTPKKRVNDLAAKRPANRKPKPEPTPAPADPEADAKTFDAALAAPAMIEKARLLRAFIDGFPDSELREDAFTYLITTRAEMGADLIRAGDTAAGIASFKLALEEAPSPIPDRLFNDVILKIPGNLFFSDQRPAAMELAQLIEKKVAASPKHLLGVAAFYLGIENGSEARRVAEAAIAVDPASAAGYQALGLAHRLNFDLEDSAKAYAKAVEVDPGSVPAKRSLAEMSRALGKPEAAAAIYRELLAANENDGVARQGLILSLFDAGQQKEAESELAKALPSESRNFALLTSVAYWYAANEQGDKAIEHAQKAVEIEPRYIWGHIALARGMMRQNRPIDAERALLRARQYGNFPTLDYEIASARFQAGLYREATEELKKSFALKDGLVSTKLGGRIYKEEKSFQDLIAHERRASLLQPLPADRAETSEKLKILFELSRKIEQSGDEAEIATLADTFVNGTDKMKLHRQLYAANLLLQKNVALVKAAELVKASIANLDAGLDVPAPGAAVMASELYESRSIAFARNEVIVIPEVPRQTLSAILRGRIEELAGWTLYQQKNYPEAAVRLRRSVSVLPDKSAWWRSSMWRLGAALEADGKDKEALDSYIKSYVTDRPTVWKYGTIEALYRKVNGSTDGLEEKIGANPLTAASTPQPAVQPPAAAPTPAVVSSAAPTEPPPSPAANINRRFPRHVPADTTAMRTEAEKPAAAVKPEGVPETREKGIPAPSPESLKIIDSKDLEPKTDASAVQASPADIRPADGAVPPPEPGQGKDQPKAADAETLPQIKPEPAPEIKSSPAAEDPRPAAVQKDVPAEPQASKPETVPAAVIQTDRPPSETEKAAVSTNSPETKDPGNTGSAQVPAKEEPAVAKTDENVAAKEDTSALRSVPDQAGIVKAEAEAPAKDTLASGDGPRKSDSASPAGNVQGSAPKAEPPPAVSEGEKAVKAETPANAETAKTEPVNLLREPFLNAQPEQPKPEPPSRKPLIIINDPYKGGDKPAPKTKSIFEPVIISVPGGKPKTAPAGTEPQADAAGSSSTPTRRRVIDGKEIISDQQCSIAVSQESIMLLSGGGSLGLRVSINGEGDVKDITASSGSPRDIEVRPEPAIDGVTGRRFYVIKSISDRTGIFQVNFESPCGKREIAVHVR